MHVLGWELEYAMQVCTPKKRADLSTRRRIKWSQHGIRKLSHHCKPQASMLVWYRTKYSWEQYDVGRIRIVYVTPRLLSACDSYSLPLCTANDCSQAREKENAFKSTRQNKEQDFAPLRKQVSSSNHQVAFCPSLALRSLHNRLRRALRKFRIGTD